MDADRHLQTYKVNCAKSGFASVIVSGVVTTGATTTGQLRALAAWATDRNADLRCGIHTGSPLTDLLLRLNMPLLCRSDRVWDAAPIPNLGDV
jgi:hypothetical protein